MFLMESSNADVAHERKLALTTRMVSILLLAILPYSAANAASGLQTTDLVSITDRSAATGGTAILRRTADMFQFKIDAVGLVPGNAYVLLLTVFDRPGHCRFEKFQTCEFTVDSNALGGDPEVGSTTVYLTGGVADNTGSATFRGRLEEGPRGLAGREVLEGTGTINIPKAQIQVIVRDMGIWKGAGGNIDPYGQITQRGFGCEFNTCNNVQIATFD